jgi:hypothetical protein
MQHGVLVAVKQVLQAAGCPAQTAACYEAQSAWILRYQCAVVIRLNSAALYYALAAALDCQPRTSSSLSLCLSSLLYKQPRH